MSRELRVAGLLASPQFLATLALFCVLLATLGAGWAPRSEALVPLFVILLLQQLTLRIVRVGAADIWRLLPGGFTVLIRAVALLMSGLALLVGGLWSWSNGQLAFNSVPLGRMVFCFVLLSAISVVMAVAIRRRRGEFFVLGSVAGCGMLIAVLFQSFPDPALWWAAALLLVSGWLYACSGKLPPPRASRRAADSREARTGTALAGFRGWQVRFNPAARNLLQLEGKVPGRLALAAAVVVTVSLVQHLLHRHGAFVLDNQAVSGTMALWLALFFVFEMAVAMTARARLLWMRTGNGRGGVFLAVERMLLVNVALLSLAVWLVNMLLAALRGASIQPMQAGLVLVCYAASALGPMYLAMIAGTLQGWLSKSPVALLGVAAMVISPFLWLYALGIRNAGLDGLEYAVIAPLTAAVLLLRLMAAWRWRHLDWSKIRITPREPWTRRELNS